MDHFVTVSDAKGLSVGFYPTDQLPVAKEAANFVLADNFFHAAFGGSFLNHQWLICACTPVYANAVSDGGSNDLHTILGANGLPLAAHDGQRTTNATGDFPVNTIFPAQSPTTAATARTGRPAASSSPTPSTAGSGTMAGRRPTGPPRTCGDPAAACPRSSSRPVRSVVSSPAPGTTPPRSSRPSSAAGTWPRW